MADISEICELQTQTWSFSDYIQPSISDCPSSGLTLAPTPQITAVEVDAVEQLLEVSVRTWRALHGLSLLWDANPAADFSSDANYMWEVTGEETCHVTLTIAVPWLYVREFLGLAWSADVQLWIGELQFRMVEEVAQLEGKDAPWALDPAKLAGRAVGAGWRRQQAGALFFNLTLAPTATASLQPIAVSAPLDDGLAPPIELEIIHAEPYFTRLQPSQYHFLGEVEVKLVSRLAYPYMLLGAPRVSVSGGALSAIHSDATGCLAAAGACSQNFTVWALPTHCSHFGAEFTLSWDVGCSQAEFCPFAAADAPPTAAYTFRYTADEFCPQVFVDEYAAAACDASCDATSFGTCSEAAKYTEALEATLRTGVEYLDSCEDASGCGSEVLDAAIAEAGRGCCLFGRALPARGLQHLCYWRFTTRAPSEAPSKAPTPCHTLRFRAMLSPDLTADTQASFEASWFLGAYHEITNHPPMYKVQVTHSDFLFHYWSACIASEADEHAVQLATCQFNFEHVFNALAGVTMRSLVCFSAPDAVQTTTTTLGPAVTLRAITLDETGRTATVEFAGATDRGLRAGLPGAASCADVFQTARAGQVDDAILGTGATCKFTSDSTLRVYLGSGTDLQPGDVFRFGGLYAIQTKAVASVACTDEMPVRWRAVSDLPSPTVVIQGPKAVASTLQVQRLNACSPISLDLDGSVGSGNRAWEVQWYADGAAYAQGATAPVAANATTYRAEVTNWVGNTGAQEWSVAVSSEELADVRIYGATETASGAVTLFSSAEFPCGQPAALLGGIYGAAYQWTATGGATLAGAATAVLRATNLTAGTTYNFTLQVTLAGVTSAVSHQVAAVAAAAAAPAPRYAELMQQAAHTFAAADFGGAAFECELIRDFYLDHWSAAFDHHKEPCGYEGASVTIQGSSLALGFYYRLYVVSNGIRGAEITIAGNRHDGEVFCMLESPVEVASENLRLVANCFDNNPEVEWTCGTFDCSEVFVSADGRLGALDLSAGAVAGSLYEYSLQFARAEARTRVRVNANPFGGACVQTPAPKVTAFETTVEIRCSQWDDAEANFPLEYDFQIRVSDIMVTLQRSPSRVWRGPVGYNGGTVEFFVTVRDSLGMATTVPVEPITVEQPTDLIHPQTLFSTLEYLTSIADVDTAMALIAAYMLTNSYISYGELFATVQNLRQSTDYRNDVVLIERYLQASLLIFDRSIYSEIGGHLVGLSNEFSALTAGTRAMSYSMGSLFLLNTENVLRAVPASARRRLQDANSTDAMLALQKSALRAVVLEDLPNQRIATFTTGGGASKYEATRASRAEFSNCAGSDGLVVLPAGFGARVNSTEFTCTLISTLADIYPTDGTLTLESPALDFDVDADVDLAACSPLLFDLQYKEGVSHFVDDIQGVLLGAADLGRDIPDGEAFAGSRAYVQSLCARVAQGAFAESSACWVVDMSANRTRCACSFVGIVGISNRTVVPLISLFEQTETPELTEENVRHYPDAFICLVNLWAFSLVLVLFLPNHISKPFLAAPEYLPKARRLRLFSRSFAGNFDQLLTSVHTNFFKAALVFASKFQHEHPFFGIFLHYPGSNYSSRQRSLVFLTYQSTLILLCAFYYADNDDPFIGEVVFILITSLAALVPVFALRILFQWSRPRDFVAIAKTLAEWEASRLLELEKVVTQRLAGVTQLPFAEVEDGSDFEDRDDAGEVDYFSYVGDRMKAKLRRAQELAGEEPGGTGDEEKLGELDLQIQRPPALPALWKHFRERILLIRELYPLPAACKRVGWALGLVWSALCCYLVLHLGLRWFSETRMQSNYYPQNSCASTYPEFINATLNNLTDAYSNAYREPSVNYGFSAASNSNRGTRWAYNTLITTLLSMLLVSPLYLALSSCILVYVNPPNRATKRLKSWIGRQQI